TLFPYTTLFRSKPEELPVWQERFPRFVFPELPDRQEPPQEQKKRSRARHAKRMCQCGRRATANRPRDKRPHRAVGWPQIGATARLMRKSQNPQPTAVGRR